jgi:hypothetical protein
MRDNSFLKERLEYLWNNAFQDVERKNEVNIRFKGRWKNKFGHIKKLPDGNSEIVVNGYFKDIKIPGYIIDLTIAHELVHYSHGFNSPLPRLYKHPHKGGIVIKDLKKRGFSDVIFMERNWIKNEWRNIARSDFKPRQRANGLWRFMGFRV